MTDLPSILFAALVVQAPYLLKRAFEAPNPDPNHAQKADPIANPKFIIFLNLYSYALGGIGLIHGLFSLSPSAEGFCPSPSALDPDLFSWTLPTALLLLTCLFGGYLRLLAYSQLRGNFTFRLARPSELVQDGIYAWIQHPSYTGAVLLIACYCGLFLRPGGVLGCWLGSASLNILVYGNWIFLAMAMVLTYPPRISREEKMLHDTFGKVWEDYHRRTARFIPLVV
ncbi:hypothetical protein ASPWEDRAFT_65659 [Aspergillus wentii DTO 134E9]|uniref:Protein-S-isoprenylcysteine O-methyltransferase n=1 Tax=Aspergillus wentii DTO 134E9 TaxID=1073089 RepID=A0A1L9RUR0_ASPWE|nr:uncharacterized protein ASPWEDRAFT_65659 [Aspergillus wentii DTO 134E9]KAI9928597.1 hypothetical protein MW887_001812 [Aspergillus wentii]OJJ38671.1 hypothetical protein ASPWEDRAFT_65659 [Aspergillus wentii DTO 134E9]